MAILLFSSRETKTILKWYCRCHQRGSRDERRGDGIIATINYVQKSRDETNALESLNVRKQRDEANTIGASDPGNIVIVNFSTQPRAAKWKPASNPPVFDVLVC